MSQRSNIVQPLRSQQLGRHLTTSDAEINTHLHPLIGLQLSCSSPTNNDSGFDEDLTQTGNFPLQQKHLADLCLHSIDPNSENRQPFPRHRQKEQRRPGPLSFEAPSAPYGPFSFDLSTPFVVPPPALLLSTPVLQSIPVLSPTGLFWPPLTPQTTVSRWSSLESPGQPSVTPNAYEVTSEVTKTPLTKASVSSQPPSCQRQREDDRGLSAELLLSVMARLQQNVREMVRLSLQRAEANPSSTMATTSGHHHHQQQQMSKEGEEFGPKSMKRRSSTKGESSSSKWLKYDGRDDACFPLSPLGRTETEEDEKVTRIASRRCDLLPVSERGNVSTDGNGTVTVHTKTKSTTVTPADEVCLNKGGLLNGIHLRKAKLMFLYARYPTSSYLKSFFPEVSFTRYNTAQLVKWFSNFREFFYIHIERYVRGLIASGLKSVDSVHITPSHELCRTMILHYNRGLETKMPIEFPTVIEQAARQFFAAISSGADSKPSWKKNIYKNIAQLDQPIPESFRYESGLKMRP
nr:unnamed protein product [Spirometra erinaceieuropaei]